MEKPLEYYLNKVFIFPKTNKIPWGQDFCYYSENAPGRVKFRLEKFLTHEPEFCVSLKAPGYGERGNYGCGGICCDLADIVPYMRKR